MSRLMSLLVLVQLTGCIVIDGDLWVPCGKGGPPCEDPRYDTGDTGVVDDSAAPVETAWRFDPAEITAGQTQILSLSSDPMSDYSQVAELQVYGDLTVCATEAREDELLATISAAPDAAPGPVDVVVVCTDGEGTWLEDAITVIGAEQPSPETEEAAPSGVGCL